ncbi:phosphonate transporter [Longibacter salinarum]|uniref:Phosphonate transporter n=1 Tax=Longibacter salinarum TaxID=1850348 RepID=A0A2A8D199_9BACT|nr:PAS domain-containing protein [Longibacter salinarum]PEN14587.1 phosphonate transporter [Longibacter salinarum]
MPDPSSDLYSFLQSKEYISEDEESSDSEENGSHLRAVNDFEDDAQSAAKESDSNLSFDTDDVGEKLRHTDPDALNDADFGIIRIDDNGVVQFFNQYESELSGVAPSDAEGQNFFSELAPCSNNRLFRGRFKEGIRKGELDERFTYTYTYKMRPTLVDVRLYRDDDGQNWILVQKQ